MARTFMRRTPFYSHVSPFACLLNAFHTLAVWSAKGDGCRGYNEPEDPINLSQLLSSSLSALGIPEDEVISIVEYLSMICTVIQSILLKLEAEGPSWVNPGSTSGGSNSGSGPLTRSQAGGSGGGGGLGFDFMPSSSDGCIQRYGLSGLNFGTTQAARDSDNEVYDARSLILHDTSIKSGWSKNSGENGENGENADVVEELGFGAPPEEPSLAQQIANEWCQAQLHACASPLHSSIDTSSSFPSSLPIAGDGGCEMPRKRAGIRVLHPMKMALMKFVVTLAPDLRYSSSTSKQYAF